MGGGGCRGSRRVAGIGGIAGIAGITDITGGTGIAGIRGWAERARAACTGGAAGRIPGFTGEKEGMRLL
jgi:hypothetical protein